MHALVAEAMKKAAVVWIGVEVQPAYPVWCMPAGEALCVVTGGAEQPAPGMLPGATVRVSARGDHGGRIVTWPARVSRVRPESEQWAAVVPQLAAKRLNGPSARDLVGLWARTAVVSRLNPTEPPG